MVVRIRVSTLLSILVTVVYFRYDVKLFMI